MTILELDIKNIGYIIRERRLDLNMTQKDLSNLTGIAQATLSAYEQELSVPSLTTLMRIFKALKIDEVRIAL